MAFANGQYILIERTAYDAAGGHQAVRDRFVEDIALRRRVKALGLPIRVALARGIVSCRMYASFAQLVRGWSRIFYDALGRKPWRLTMKLLDPVIFCQTGHLALAAGLVLSARGGGTFAYRSWQWVSPIMSSCTSFSEWFIGRRSSRASFPLGYPIANLIVDLILIRAIRMCLTGNVTWSGTDYAVSDSPSSSGAGHKKQPTPRHLPSTHQDAIARASLQVKMKFCSS